ncbi:hypothetical protein P9112_010532 [Eukaryota sp. TZLM1-RC]
MALIDLSVGSFIIDFFPQYSANLSFFRELCQHHAFTTCLLDLLPQKLVYIKSRLSLSPSSELSPSNPVHKDKLHKKGSIFLDTSSPTPVLVVSLVPLKSWIDLYPLGVVVDDHILDVFQALPVKKGNVKQEDKIGINVRLLKLHFLDSRLSSSPSNGKEFQHPAPPELSLVQLQQDLPYLESLQSLKNYYEDKDSTVEIENSSVLIDRPDRSEPQLFRLFVGNLAFKTTVTKLEFLFSSFSSFHSAEIIKDSLGRSKAFGYVYFSSDVLEEAIRMHNGHVIDGRTIRVERSMKRRHVGGRVSKRRRSSHW